MSKEAIVGRWFTKFWGETCDLGIVDELAAPEMLLQHSLHEPRRGREDIKAFMMHFRKAFPDLNFWGAADSSRRATMWSAAGKVVARTQDQPSRTSWLDLFQLPPAGRCGSRELPCCESRMARSRRRSVWMME